MQPLLCLKGLEDIEKLFSHADFRVLFYQAFELGPGQRDRVAFGRNWFVLFHRLGLSLVRVLSLVLVNIREYF